jgi:hypothetical protein
MDAMKELEKLMEENKDVLIRLKEGEEMKYPNCPAEDYTCPYCLASGECIIDNPKEECDTWYYYNEEEEEEEE